MGGLRKPVVKNNERVDRFMGELVEGVHFLRNAKALLKRV
jgi:hypothetical protein